MRLCVSVSLTAKVKQMGCSVVGPSRGKDGARGIRLFGLNGIEVIESRTPLARHISEVWCIARRYVTFAKCLFPRAPSLWLCGDAAVAVILV